MVPFDFLTQRKVKHFFKENLDNFDEKVILAQEKREIKK